MFGKKTNKFQSLTVTLAITFLALSAIFLLSASSLEMYFNLKSQREMIAIQQQFIAQEAANSVKSYIQNKIGVLETATSIGDLETSNHEEQKLVLHKLQALDPAFRQLGLLNKQGEELERISRVSKLSVTQSIMQFKSELFPLVSQGKTYVSSVYIEKITCEPLMIIAVPVTNIFGDFRGGLIAEVNLKFMWNLVDRLEVGKTGVAYVVDKQGNLIAFNDMSRVLRRENLIYLEEVAKFAAEDESLHESTFDISKGIRGDRVIANHADLGTPDWSVVVELPIREAYQSVIEAIERSVLLMFIGFVLATITGIYLSKKITKPVITLRNATKKISTGNLDTQIEITSNDEIGELAVSFNQMVDDLKRTTVSRDELAVEVVERKKAEKQAETASKAKSQFLANMSHEIRTPMNAMLGFTKLLEQTRLDDVQMDYVKTMLISGDLLLGLINDILDLSKIQDNTFELECIEFDFMYLIESVISMIKSKMVGSPVDVLYSMKNIPGYYKGDPTRIRQILINLIGNAIKFTEAGEIFITIDHDPGDIHGGGEPGLMRTLKISIRDTGIGIPEDKKESIFAAFTQADTSTTRKYGGTGLGLSITKSFVEKMGGKIWVESVRGHGSEFIFTVNLEQAKAITEAEINPVSLKSLKGKRVIIVDDNPNAGKIFREYCLTAKMEVPFVARSAPEALSFLTTEKTLPDLIICDMMMPEMDGHELIEEIRKDDKLREIKIIAATSEAIPGQSKNAEIKGFDGFLSKPVIRKELINVIRAVFGDKREAGSDIITRHRVKEISFKGINVLVVEDNPVNMKLISALLKKYGIVIDKAQNGKEAVEKMRENDHYDIVFMDMQMPEMNGIDATKIIRSEINKEIPVIALTAAVMKDDRDQCLSAGMNDVLAKPIDVNLLKEILQKYS